MKMTYEQAKENIVHDGIDMGAGDYISIAALEVAVEAIEKQVPKKPTYVDTRFRNHGRHVGDGCSLDRCYKCPSCWSHIFHVFDSEKYCIHCGQALDWGEEAKG